MLFSFPPLSSRSHPISTLNHDVYAHPHEKKSHSRGIFHTPIHISTPKIVGGGWRAVSTGWSKKTDTQFYFWDNFGNSAPILTILSLLLAEIYGP